VFRTTFNSPKQKLVGEREREREEDKRRGQSVQIFVV
jgi:hypothetical protein